MGLCPTVLFLFPSPTCYAVSAFPRQELLFWLCCPVLSFERKLSCSVLRVCGIIACDHCSWAEKIQVSTQNVEILGPLAVNLRSSGFFN